MSFDQALNLSDGRDMVNVLELTSQPRMVADSDGMPSAASFDRDKQSSLLIGSTGEMGLNMV